jgi:hypothetical protein
MSEHKKPKTVETKTSSQHRKPKKTKTMEKTSTHLRKNPNPYFTGEGSYFKDKCQPAFDGIRTQPGSELICNTYQPSYNSCEH